jgi:hypothetical protein
MRRPPSRFQPGRISDFRYLSAALVDPRPYCDLKAQADSPF